MPLTGQSANIVLDSLTEPDRAALAPHLTEVWVEKGDVLIHQMDEVKVAHFPISADLSNMLLFSDGRSIEATAVGRDGVTGLAAFLADQPIAWTVVCQTPGLVMAIEADLLRRQVKASPDLLALLVRVTHDNQSQAAQTVACNTLHEVTQRLARWLLMVSDRTGRRSLDLTQEGMAAQLGAQRTTINGAAQTLRQAKAITFSRGRLEITDRAALERAACECYRDQVRRSEAYGLRLTPP